MSEQGPRWRRDPTGQHELRYWTGTHWSRYVSDGVKRSVDPMPDDTPHHRSEVPRHRRARTRRGWLPHPGLLVTAVVLVAAVVATTLAARSGGNGSGVDESDIARPPDPLLDNVAAYFYDDGNVTRDQSVCMADAVVGAIGRDPLVAAGVETTAPRNVTGLLTTEETIRAALPAAADCLPDGAVAAFTASLFPTNLGIDPVTVTCWTQGWMTAVGRAGLLNIFLAVLVGGSNANADPSLQPEERAAMLQVAGECGPIPPGTTP